MASKKGFKPPITKSSESIQINNNRSKPPKLSTSKYAVISDAVIHFKGNRSPTPAESLKIKTSEPKEGASVKNSRTNLTDSIAQSKINPDENYCTKTSAVVSIYKKSYNIKTINNTSASESEPTKRFEFKTPKTYRETLNMMENDPQFFSTRPKRTLSGPVALKESPLSQPSEHLSHRERLEWLQARRGVGLWIQCDTCKKWRWSEVDDPVDVPKDWTCANNPDFKYNQCQIPQQAISVYVMEDLIHNKFTAGSIVWVKMYGYPWWPAMVDDCPDTEQYYWLDQSPDIPTSYHVVFFDCKQNEITRSWIPTRCILSFKHHPNLDRKFTVPLSFQHRVTCAKHQAALAVQFNVKQRLARYSFLARWKEDIVTPPPSDSQPNVEDASSEVTETAQVRAPKNTHKDSKSKGSHAESVNEKRKFGVPMTDKRQKQMQENDGFDENGTFKKAQADFMKLNREPKEAKPIDKMSKSAGTQLKNEHSFENRKYGEILENIKLEEKKAKYSNKNPDYDKKIDNRSSQRDSDHDKSKNQASKHSTLELSEAKSEFVKINQPQSKVEKASDTLVESYVKPYPKASYGEDKLQPGKENVLNKWRNQLCVEPAQMPSKDFTNRASIKTHKLVSSTGQREDSCSQELIIIVDSSDDEQEKRSYGEEFSSMEAVANYTKNLLEDYEAKKQRTLQNRDHSENNMNVINGTEELDTSVYRNKSNVDVPNKNIEELNNQLTDDLYGETQIDIGRKIKSIDFEAIAKKVNKRKTELKSIIKQWNRNESKDEEKKEEVCKEINKMETHNKNVNKPDSEDADREKFGKVSKTKRENQGDTHMIVTTGKQESKILKFTAKRRLPDYNSDKANVSNKLAKASTYNDLGTKTKKYIMTAMRKTLIGSESSNDFESELDKNSSLNENIHDSKGYKPADSVQSASSNGANYEDSVSAYSSEAAVVPNSEDRLLNAVQNFYEECLPFEEE